MSALFPAISRSLYLGACLCALSAQASEQGEPSASHAGGSAQAPEADSTLPSRDSAAPVRPVYRWQALPAMEGDVCPQAAESAPACWRSHPSLANQETGFPGVRSWTLSLTRWEPASFTSPFFPAARHSPYLLGGLAPPDRFVARRSGGDVSGLEETWSPVTPLDTPLTRLDWERGALALNVFDLRFQRMLSDRVYLDLEYYSATAESRFYDYPFNVHQPYLSGWGVLGKLYAPIDRDSASLVIRDTSHGIHALDIRPRVGFWIDTNQVIEFFLDRVKNGTNLTRPRGAYDPAAPGREDSAQSLLASELSSYTEGLIYARRGRGWTSQWDAAYTSLDENIGSIPDSLGGTGGEEGFAGRLFRARGAAQIPALPGAPFLRMEGAAETWEGRLFLKGWNGPEYAQAWNERGELEAGWRPRWGWLSLEAQARAGGSRRMDERTVWLGGFGALAKLETPWGLRAEAGAAYRDEEPEWEMLYRRNPVLGRYPNPELDPRTSQSGRVAVAWDLPHLTLEAGADWLRLRDSWLPYVLPQRGACNALADSVYGDLAASRCRSDESLPDSLALRLRNYGEERRDSWHAGANVNLGRWNLSLSQHFLYARRVDDTKLSRALINRQIPDRIFKGHLGWRRALVDGRMKLALAWDWEWFSTRYAWASGLDGYAYPVKLDEYLALDFSAGMQIKSFLLYFKGMNLNHDRYASEPGVHPPGVNFRFGVDWVLWN